MKLIADNTIPYLKGIAEPFADITYLNSAEFTPEAIKDADALIVRSIDKCTRNLLDNSKVRLIVSATIGFDHIDTHYCEEAGITWKNAPGCNARSVAQFLLAGLFVISLRKAEPLRGKTIGIVGVGHVGKEVEKIAKAYGLHVLLNDPPRAKEEGEEGFVSLETIVKEADIITFHTPFTREGEFPTYHLANEDFFESLERKPWFINASRGAVHDTHALLEARKNGKLGALLLDCWENEPAINLELLDLTDLATPHVAGFSADGKANGTRMCLENIASFFDVHFDKLGEVAPPPPASPIIDLSIFHTNRIEEAVLQTFNPRHIDQALRETPERFEFFRNNYAHPREFEAYTVKNATTEESELLKRLGFNVQS